MTRVLLTGAASGIGAATATMLRARGATVIGLDVHGDGDAILTCDVRDQAAVDAAVAEAATRLGGIDVVINCAGVGDPQSAGAAPGPDAERVLAVNLVGPWRVTAAALPHVRAARGRVVNVASGLAHLTVPFATAYCMSKRGLVAYSDALRLEYGDEITVTTVYPGYVRTPIHDVSLAKGLALEGSVPAETLEQAAGTLVRAALGPPARDLATTRQGTVQYGLLRIVPRRVMDRLIGRTLRANVRKGTWDTGLAAEFASRTRERAGRAA